MGYFIDITPSKEAFILSYIQLCLFLKDAVCLVRDCMPRGMCLAQSCYVSCAIVCLDGRVSEKEESMPSTIYARAVMSHIINGPCDTWQWFLARTW